MDIFFTILLLFTALVTCVSSQTCERSHYENCLNKLLSFTDKGHFQFAPSLEELQQECVQAQTALRCLTTYTKKCLSLEERPQFIDGISGPERVTLALCTEDAFKTSYINSLPCLKNISEGLQYCKEKYERNQKDIILVEYEDKTQLQCCSFDGYRRCLRMVLETKDTCKETMAEFLEQLADKLGGVLTQGTCSEHFERCTGHSGGTQIQPSKYSPFITLFSAANIAISLLFMSVL